MRWGMDDQPQNHAPSRPSVLRVSVIIFLSNIPRHSGWDFLKHQSRLTQKIKWRPLRHTLRRSPTATSTAKSASSKASACGAVRHRGFRTLHRGRSTRGWRPGDDAGAVSARSAPPHLVSHGSLFRRTPHPEPVPPRVYRQQQHIPEHVLPSGLSASELYECVRVLKSLPLRQKIYN